jgi:hypothetical protein
MNILGITDNLGNTGGAETSAQNMTKESHSYLEPVAILSLERQIPNYYSVLCR